LVGIGRIIGGVILLMVGIIIVGVGMTVSSIQSNNLGRCNTFTGQLGQSLDPETAEICASAPVYQGMSNAAIIIGFILSVLGIVLVILGAVSRSKHKEKKVENVVSPRREDSVVGYTKKLSYCRYCGKQRETSGEFCSMCGRSSHSSSATTRRCTSCNATMSEDSEFCVNCGQKFEERTTTTEGTKRFYYTSDGKRKERSTPI
jgi:uncharacterized membrane protein